MRIKTCLAAAIATSIVAAPVAAQAAGSEGLRSGSLVKESEGAVGSGLVLAGFVAALATFVIIASDDDDEPVSP